MEAGGLLVQLQMSARKPPPTITTMPWYLIWRSSEVLCVLAIFTHLAMDAEKHLPFVSFPRAV